MLAEDLSTRLTIGLHIETHQLTCGIDGEENRPGDDGSNQANGRQDLEEPQEEVVVERVVIEHILVLDAAIILDPAEEAR